MTNPEIRTIEEAYSSAVSTSNLKVGGEDHVGDCDKIIAAGWSKHLLGNALTRLRGEYDAAARPRMAIAAQFWYAAKHDLENEMKGSGQGPTSKQINQLAHERAHAFNLHETGMFLQRLKSLHEVRVRLSTMAVMRGVEAADDKVIRVVRWWLDDICPACGGTENKVVPGSNRHGSEKCDVCDGTGKKKKPCGKDGLTILSIIEDARQSHVAYLRKKLPGMRKVVFSSAR